MNTLQRYFFAVSLVGCSVGSSQAAGTFNDEMANAAKQIHQFMMEEKQESIAVGSFDGLAKNTNFGPAIERALGDDLRLRKIKLDAKSPWTVSGTWHVRGEFDQRLTILIVFRIADSTGQLKNEFFVEIKNNADIAKMMGLTMSFPKNADEEFRNEKIGECVAEPKVYIDQTKVTTGKDSEFAVEILTKPSMKKPAVPAKAETKEGFAFATIGKSEMFDIKLHNRSKHESAACVSVDGLDVFINSGAKDPQTGRPRFAGFIIPAGESLVVRGWHKINKKTEPFLAKGTGKVGVVHVAFRQSGDSLETLRANSLDKCCPGFEDTTCLISEKSGYKEVSRKLGRAIEMISVRFGR